MKDLIDIIAMEECHLRSIALVQMKLNFPLDNLAKILENENLQDLDISANDCLPIHFVPLLKALAHNKTLQSVNLSWN